MENKKQKFIPVRMSLELKKFNLGLGLSFFAITALTAVVLFVSATDLSDKSDTMSNQSAAQLSSHTIAFTLTGGNIMTAGESVVIDFREDDGAFSVSGATFTAADISFNDGAARTIFSVTNGAANCAGSVGADDIAVGIDDAAGIMTFLACPSFNQSGAGASVTIALGAVAGGADRITNPAVGTHLISVTDAAGDCQGVGGSCSIYMPVIDGDNLSITAIVDPKNHPPPTDTTPPAISNVQAVNITKNFAEITWDTNEASTSIVHYGLTAAYGSTRSDPAFVMTGHTVGLSGLSEGMLYHYKVCSVDSASNQGCSGDNTFTTLDETPPVISNVQVISITDTTAVITWDTNENADSNVDYDTVAGPPYGNTGSDAVMAMTHSVLLTDLIPNTVYHYRVRSGDASANESFTTDATFTTVSPPDSTPPVISNIQVINITRDSAAVTWDTDEAADSKADYDLDGDPYDDTETDGTAVLNHSIDLTGLLEKTLYHFRVRSADSSANEAASGDLTFMTADATAPVISNVQVINITDTTATVTWDTDEAADSAVDYGSPMPPPYADTESDAALVTLHSIDLTGLAPSAVYHYSVRSADAGGNGAVTADQTFSTIKPAPPVISNIRVTNITETGARVLWDTDTLSDSTTDYGTTDAYGDTEYNATLGTAGHMNVLAELTQGTTYHFRVRSTDQYSQESVSADQTFATVADTTPPANVTNFTATPGDSEITLNWVNPADADFWGVVIRRKATGFPTGPTDGDQVYDGMGTTHLDTGRTNGVMYYYAAFAYDGVPNYASGAIASATPVGPPDTTPPGETINLVATPGDGQVQLTWTNPADPDFLGTKIQRKEGTCATGLTDGVTVHNGPGTSRLDPALVNGTLYCYTAYAFDAAVNYAAGVDAVAIPQAAVDVTPPGPVVNLRAAAGDSQVQLTWQNPPDADWAGTRLVRKTGGPSSDPLDGMIVASGVIDSHLDTGLVNGTTYFYTAFAYDTSSNFSNGVLVSATPLAGAPPPPPPSCTDSDGGKNYQVRGFVFESPNTFTDKCVDPMQVEENFCLAGARQSETHDCGVGFKCSAGRCVVDTYVPTPSLCGNGICDGIENSISCPQDCPVTPAVPPVEEGAPTVQEELRLGLHDVHFYTTAGDLRLRLMDGNRLIVYPNMTVRVHVPAASIPKTVASAFVNFRDSSYVMRNTGNLDASVTTPSDLGRYPLTVIVSYNDGTGDSVRFNADVQPFATVYEMEGGQRKPVPQARVTLLQDIGGGNFGVWDGSKWGQINPQLTNENGSYGFIGEPGAYKLKVEMGGYRTKETLAFPVDGNIIRRDIGLIRLPPEIKIEKAEDVVEVVTEQAAYAAKTVAADVAEVVGNEYVEETMGDVAPVAVAVAVANVAAAGAATATAIPYLLYLYSFLAHPTLLFARRKRRKWGIVFDGITQRPVDLAIVRLLDAETGRILRSAVTDKGGRYFFIVQKGRYLITAAKSGYTFPTSYLKDEKETARFPDVYHGEEIDAKEETTITVNIPIDPVEYEKTPRRVVWEGVGRRLQASVSVMAIGAMGVAVVITPTPVIIAMFIGNLIMHAIFRRIAVARRPKNWGIVYDDKTGRPVGNAVARVFESRYNKLLETQVTDARGRYAFLVGNNVYYVTFEKPGYQKQQKGPLDLMEAKKEEERIIAMDVQLSRGEKRDKGIKGQRDKAERETGKQTGVRYSSGVPSDDGRVEGERGEAEPEPTKLVPSGVPSNGGEPVAEEGSGTHSVPDPVPVEEKEEEIPPEAGDIKVMSRLEEAEEKEREKGAEGEREKGAEKEADIPWELKMLKKGDKGTEGERDKEVESDPSTRDARSGQGDIKKVVWTERQRPVMERERDKGIEGERNGGAGITHEDVINAIKDIMNKDRDKGAEGERDKGDKSPS